MEYKTKGKRPFPWSYILIFLFFSAAIITAGIFSYSVLYRRATADKKQELSSVLNLKTNQIQNWRNERFGEARFLFSNDLFKNQVYEYMNKPLAETGRNINIFLSTIKENHYHTITIYDTSGKEIYRLGESRKQASRKDIDSTIRLGTFRMTDLVLDLKDNFISLEIFVPILLSNKDSTSAVAVLMLLVDPYKELYPIITNWPTNTKTAETVFVRKEGDSVVVLNDLRHLRNSALRYRFPLNEEFPGTMAVKGYKGFYEGIDYRGEKVLSSVGNISETNWYLVVKIDQSEVYDAIYITSALIGIIILALLIVTGTGIALNARKKEYISIQNLYQKEQEKLALKEHYEHLVKQANDIILLLDYKGKIIDANDKASQVYEYTMDELLSMNISDLRKPEFRDYVKNMLESSTEGGLIYETAHCKKNGEVIYVEVSSRALEINSSRYIQNIIRNISERKLHEARIRRLNHVYAVLSEVNQAIVKTRNSESLFRKICDIAVSAGEFRAAAYGRVDKKTNKTDIVASSPGMGKFFRNMEITLQYDSEEGKSLSIFLQDGEYFICNDIRECSLKEEWKNDALEQNFRSFGVFPIRITNRIIGLLLFFSDENNFFTGEEINLLTDVSNDISYALQMMELEQKRSSAEEELRKSELNLKTLAANLPETNVLMFNRKLEIFTAEGSELDVFKTDKSVLKGRDIASLFPAEYNLHEKFLQVFDDKTSEDEIRIDDKVYTLKMHPIKTSTGEISLGIAVLQDITSRIKNEDALKESESRLRGFFNLNNVYMAVVELRGKDIYYIMPNKKLAGLYNMPPEELSKHSLRELSGEDVNIYWLDIYKGIWKYKRPVSIEFSIKKDDYIMWLVAEICNIESQENPLFSYVAFDITDRKV